MPSHFILINFIGSLSRSQNICIAPSSARTWCRGAGFSEYKKNLFLCSPLLHWEVSLDYSLSLFKNLGSAQGSRKEGEHSGNKWPNRDGKEQGRYLWKSYRKMIMVQREERASTIPFKTKHLLCTSWVFKCLDFRCNTV